MLTAEEAVAAIERCAMEVTETMLDGQTVDRRIVHCFMGGIGADWDVESAVECVRDAYVNEGVPQIAWIDTVFGRCLVVLQSEPDGDGGRRRLFDTVVPE